MPAESPPPRLVLRLGRESLSLWVRRADGTQGSLGDHRVGSATLASTLSSLIQAATTDLLRGAKPPRLELVLLSERPRQALLRGELPPVSLLCTAGVHEALHAALSPQRHSQVSAGAGRSPLHPCFPWVGDAAELWPSHADLSALCPQSQLIPVAERLAADGTVIKELSREAKASLVQQAMRLGAPAAVVLLHSPRNPTHETGLTAALHAAGLCAIASHAELPAHRGGLDERLRLRAAVVSAALAPGWQADLAAVRAALAEALPSGLPVRLFALRPDGAIAPVERVPLWKLLLSPLAAVLRGAALSQPEGSDGRFGLLTEPEPASKPDSDAESLHLAAICQPETPVWQPGSSTLCLGIPSELPGASVVVGDSAQVAASRLGLLALSQGFSLAEDRDAETTTDEPAALGLVPLQKKRLPTGQAMASGALTAPIRDELIQLLCAEASGAQESGLLSATLRRLQTTGAAPGSETATAPAEPRISPKSEPADCGQSPTAGWTADLRYQGQLSALSLRGVGTGGPAASAATDLVVRFVAEHERVYGFSLPQCPVELLQVRLTSRS